MNPAPIRRPAEVRVEGLIKRFGRRAVLDRIDVAIAPGRITAIVGPNAAGKSTLIKAIIGLVKTAPGDGRILVDGAPVNGDYRYRSRIGYMPQAAQFPSHLTGREILRLVEDLRQGEADLDRDLVAAFGLGSTLDQKVRTLSGGTRQKLNAVVAFLFRPTLLILDEPTAGLDPIASGILKDKVLAAPAEGTTVILTSHILSEIEELAQDIVFLIDGRVAFQGPVEGLKARSGEERLERAVASLLRAAA
jgi:Cu-processing system ATP-binding protein